MYKLKTNFYKPQKLKSFVSPKKFINRSLDKIQHKILSNNSKNYANSIDNIKYLQIHHENY